MFELKTTGIALSSAALLLGKGSAFILSPVVHVRLGARTHVTESSS